MGKKPSFHFVYASQGPSLEQKLAELLQLLTWQKG